MKRRKALKHNTATSETAVAAVHRPAFPQALLDIVTAQLAPSKRALSL